MKNTTLRQLLLKNYVHYALLFGGLFLAANQLYEHYVVGRPHTGHAPVLERVMESSYAQISPLCEQWIDAAEGDDSYLERLWGMVVPHQWKRTGGSLFMFRDTTMVYWANQLYDGEMDSLLLSSRTSSLDTIGGNLAFIIRSSNPQNTKLSAIVLHLQDLKTGALNPHMFKDQALRIHRAVPLGADPAGYERVEVAGVAFYIEPLPHTAIPLGVTILGWCGLFLILVALKRHVLLRTTKRNLLPCLLILGFSMVAIRLLVSYLNVPNQYGSAFDHIVKGNEIIPLSMGNLLVSFIFGLIFVLYLFRVRRKLEYAYKRLSRCWQYMVMVITMLLINVMVVYYHYALVGIIYNTNISSQVYDLFDLSSNAVMFMLTAGVVIAIRIIINRVSMACFSNFNIVFCIVTSMLLLALILLPIEGFIRDTGYILLLFHLVFLVVSFVWRRWIREYYVILQTLTVFAFYVTVFSTIEFNIAGESKSIEYSHKLQKANMDISQAEAEKYMDCNYALIDGNGLLLQGGNMVDIQQLLPYICSKGDTVIRVENYSHYIRHDGQGATYVVSHKTASLFDFMAFFSYIYILSFVVVMVIFYSSGVSSDMMMGWSRLAMRIRLGVMALVLVSLITLALVVTTKSREDQVAQNRININNTMQNVLCSFREYILQNPQDQEPLQRWYSSVVSSAYSMVNVYDLNGKSLDRQGENCFDRISNEAFRNLNWRDAPYYHQTITTTYDVEYISAYTTVWVDGIKYGYLNIMGNDPLQIQGQRAVMVDLINIFVVILLVVLMVSLPVYQHIMKPLYRISNGMKNIAKMKKIAAADKAAPSDEVEALILQYNKMIDYLEQSYRQLAENERDNAWREMARQVAHEIKNPLTPIRLRVQMLQRAIEMRDPDLEAKTKATLIMLLEQIDLLSKIATAFSDFSKMEECKLAHCDLTLVLKKSCDLFCKLDPKIEFTIDVPVNPVMVMADRDQLSRVFVNLCKNAVEAIQAKGDQGGLVELSLRVKPLNKAIVTIRDNGVGVAQEQIGKMFLPNFTTKSSGSGLGLAISAQIIENISGSIRFESVLGQGTVFVIEIPLLEVE